MDGNGRKKAMKLLQIISLVLFVVIMLTSIPVPNKSINFISNSNDMISEEPSKVYNESSKATETVNITESIEIVITSNNHESLEQERLKEKKEYAFTVVTGASKNHFCPVKGFIYNLKGALKGLNARLIIYDLGLTKIQQDELKRLRDNGYFDELRVFDFSIYPSFWNISESRGEYAWKPAIVAEISKEYPGIITWLDSGTLPERKYFEELPSLLKIFDGFLSPRSSGFMRKWTHPGVYEYYNDDASKYYDTPNCNCASVAFDTKITQDIINEWVACAYDKNCISPIGSSRKNHRQDQAILTYLAAREERYCNIGREYLWIHTHQDNKCGRIIKFYEKLYNQ